MSKKYLVKEADTTLEDWREIIVVPLEEMVRKYTTAGTIYVQKDDVLNLEKHQYSNIDDDFELDGKVVDNYYAIELSKVNEKIRDLINYFEGDIEAYNEETLESGENNIITIEEILNYLQDLIKEDASNLADDSYYYWHDGSNYKRILVDSSWQDIELGWVDYTDELEGMEKLEEIIREDKGHYQFYRLKDGDILAEYVSYYQGVNVVMKIYNNMTIEEVIKETIGD